PIEPQFNINGPLLMRSVPKPIIAALNGPAVGFGLTFALGCDIRIASEKATLGAVFVRVGLPPEFGGTYNLARLAGVAKACELVFSGQIIDAQEGLKIGLVNQVVPAEKLKAVTYELATTIAEGPPLAIALAKKALYQSQHVDLATQIPFERYSVKVCRDSQDHMEGVRAFIEKRKPKFQGSLGWLPF
ncbi:MAG: enoyl-CoA hydratase-related protein, partial [Chloroflexota bacterium]|nr:enoyl-CoA hydratase-related protein [Chloroflexota bacterium]